MSHFTTDAECISNRQAICERYQIWGPPTEDSTAAQVPPPREVTTVQYRGAQGEMPIIREVTHPRANKKGAKTGNLTAVHIQQTEGVKTSPHSATPEKDRYSGLWESTIMEHKLGQETFQVQRLLPQTVRGGVGCKQEGNVDMVGQTAVYLVGHQLPQRPLQGPIYSCGDTYSQWYVPYDDYGKWGL